MQTSVQNLITIKKKIHDRLNDLGKSKSPKIIAVSKTFPIDKIQPLIDHGHLDFGENKVQESVDKWSDIKSINKNIKLHFVGKLQRNKVKHVVKIFDYIHSVDNENLAKKISEEIHKINRNIKIFIQVNIGHESQKSGVDIKNLDKLYLFCKQIKLNVIGLMCLPPENEDPKKYFIEMELLAKKYNLNDLSMGMSSDYLDAIESSSTFVRIGSDIFGKRN
tara:strand:- start:935 stop:1594 length:660 start_codon:yes stop_codon:yes gene_type:complete